MIPVASWSNAEVHIGIVAANVALGRMIFFHIYHIFRPEAPQSWAGSYGSNSHSHPHHRSGDHKSRHTLTRKPSIPHSEDSNIPLDPQIKKTTEVFVSNEGRTNSTSEGGQQRDEWGTRYEA